MNNHYTNHALCLMTVVASGWLGVLPVCAATPGEVAARLKEKGISLVRDVEYTQALGKPQRLDLYLPEKEPGNRPLIVWIHGGGWEAGSKEGGSALFLAERGYAVASLNYRLSQVAKFPAQIQDCKAAVRFLRAKAGEYHLDSHRIGVWGASAGGHLVALLGTTGGVKELEGDGGNPDQSSEVQAVCDWFGPTDFCHWKNNESALDKTRDGVHASNVITRLVGGSLEANPDDYATASPITYVKGGRKFPPFLIMHGDRDTLVSLTQSTDFHEALKKAGHDSTLHIVRGAGHGFGGADINGMVESFFDRTLKTIAPAAHDAVIIAPERGKMAK